MTITQRYSLGGIIVVVILAGGIFLFTRHATAPSSAPTATSTSATASSSSADGITIKTSNGGGATIAELPTATAPTEPSLGRPLPFTGAVTLSPDAQAIISKQVANIVAVLKQDPTKLDYWIQLGIDRKIAGDYTGAAEAWMYVHELAPRDEVSVSDLGDLYMNFVHDYPKAETYYKMAIADAPKVINNYESLYTLYHDAYKVGTGADRAIIAEGLKNNPGNKTLLELQAQSTATGTAQ